MKSMSGSVYSCGVSARILWSTALDFSARDFLTESCEDEAAIFFRKYPGVDIGTSADGFERAQELVLERLDVVLDLLSPLLRAPAREPLEGGL